MARHRSPHGAETEDPERMTRLRVVATGGHRLPAPPTASLRNRATVVAAAAGAFVAAAQSMVPSLEHPAVAPITMSALLPVADMTATDASPAFAIDAIGGDQLLPDTLALGAPDPASQVDVQRLTKAVAIGGELARQASILDSALASGAAEAFLRGDSAYVRPVVGRFTSGFGARWGMPHNGIDIAAPIGTPIYALTDAVVEESGPASGFGLWVVLRHTDGTHSVYGHINRAFVKVGDRVRAGEEIAEVGNRGQSTGPHLHLEIWDVDGTKINPVPWLLLRGIRF